MLLRPPRSKRSDTLFPYTTRFRSRQFDPVRAHDACTTKLEPVGKVEDGAAVHQSGVSLVAGEIARAGRGGVRGPGRRNPPPVDALAIVGLEPIDPPRLVRQTLPHGQRSEERSVGKECVSTCRSRWST